MASDDVDLGELNLGTSLVVALHNFRHSGELRLIAPLPRGVESERRRHIVESVGIERLDRADRLVTPLAFGRGCRSAEGEMSLTETLRGEPIGNRYGGGSRVEFLAVSGRPWPRRLAPANGRAQADMGSGGLGRPQNFAAEGASFRKRKYQPAWKAAST